MADEITNTVPQLSPVQQRFLESLGSAPQNAAPFSAAGTQGFSAPGYAAAYQPAQSFDDPAYQKSLYEWEQEVRRKAEASRAEQAIQAGIRHIYQQRYDADIKRGVPEQQAFSRMMMGVAMHTPKSDPVKMFEAFRTRPAPTAQMMRFGTNEVPVIINTDSRGGQRATPVPQSALPVAPLSATGEVLKHPVTGTEMGVRFPTGPKSGQVLGKAEKSALQTEEIKMHGKQMQDASKALTTELLKKKPDAKLVAIAQQQLNSASNALSRITVGQPTQQPTTGALPSPTSKEEYDKLPSGTRYLDPNGKERVKK